jgi:hypothetical protein
VADISILTPAVATVPSGYTVTGSQELVIKAVTASFNGAAAAGNYVPAVQIVNPAGIVVGTYTLGSTLAAGASADVSFFPSVGGGSSSSGGSGTRTVRIPLTTPDSSGNAFPNLTTRDGWSNVRDLVTAFTQAVDGTWEGSVLIPIDYGSGGTINLRWAVNATTGNLRNRVGTSVVADGVTTDTAYTQESYVNTAVPGTALRRFTTSFILSTVLVASSTLFVQVTRNGASGSDTLAAIANLVGCDLTYTSLH